MENITKLVSIVTPSYNSSAFILSTYESIKNQTYTNWEWIVVDDNSRDNTIDLLEGIQNSDSRIIIFKNNSNRGPGISRSIGIENAKGNYLTFIDSDDLWHPEFLEKSIETMTLENADFVFSSYERWNETLTIKYESFIVPAKVTYKDILRTCPISCLTAFINIGKYGKKYMPDMPKRQDYVLWLDYLKEIPYAIGIQTELAKYRMRKSSLSSNKMSVIKYQFLAYFKYQKIGFLRSLFYLMNWALNGFKKYSNVDR